MTADPAAAALRAKITQKEIRNGRPGLQCPAVESVPGKVSGAWAFKNTRMPVATVFENLQDGMTIDELIETFDGLTREQIESVLKFVAQSLEVPVPAR